MLKPGRIPATLLRCAGCCAIALVLLGCPLFEGIAAACYRVIVELISATTTKAGLTVRCELHPGQYANGVVVSDAEMAAINIKRAEFHGEWNYIISPNDHPRIAH